MRLHLLALALGAAGMSSAAAQDLPMRRAGLWEITMTREGPNTPPQVMQQCTDAATDKLMNAFSGGMGAELCSKQEFRKVGATFVIDSVCQIGPVKVVSHSVVSGDFNKSYTVKVTSQMEGLPASAQAMAGGNMTIQARWIGACTADQRPGDIVINGKTMNILDLKKLMGGARPPPQPPQR